MWYHQWCSGLTGKWILDGKDVVASGTELWRRQRPSKRALGRDDHLFDVFCYLFATFSSLLVKVLLFLLPVFLPSPSSSSLLILPPDPPS